MISIFVYVLLCMFLSAYSTSFSGYLYTETAMPGFSPKVNLIFWFLQVFPDSFTHPNVVGEVQVRVFNVLSLYWKTPKSQFLPSEVRYLLLNCFSVIFCYTMSYKGILKIDIVQFCQFLCMESSNNDGGFNLCHFILSGFPIS